MAILTTAEIQSLYSRYSRVRQYIMEQNIDQPVNQRIKQVQFPSNLSESLVFHYVIENPETIGLDVIERDLLIKGNPRTFDLIYNDRINIEVKATGTSNFQRFRPHSLTANIVFWLNFEEDGGYTIALFNPNVLTPNANGEVDIRWNRLVQTGGVNFIENLNI